MSDAGQNKFVGDADEGEAILKALLGVSTGGKVLVTAEDGQETADADWSEQLSLDEPSEEDVVRRRRERIARRVRKMARRRHP